MREFHRSGTIQPGKPACWCGLGLLKESSRESSTAGYSTILHPRPTFSIFFHLFLFSLEQQKRWTTT